ncbi:hypothetical protein V499_02872 [Pseudogymnoascus sp. VKM F-103]|nr:hypothetical protein V499_02872 [Pseudogymnoascus sp. VKM F-103]
MSSTSTTGAVCGRESQYISVGPPQGQTPIGIIAVNRTTTRAEKLEMGEAKVEGWLSSPNQPLNLQPVSQGKETA